VELSIVISDSLAEINIFECLSTLTIVQVGPQDWHASITFDRECHIFGAAGETCTTPLEVAFCLSVCDVKDEE
jgi:hypothetical protein